MVNTMVGLQEARTVAGSNATGLMAALTAAFAVGQIGGPLVVSLVVTTGGGYSEGLLLASVVLAASAGVLGWQRLALREDATCG
jgi:hypothetical protein